MTLWHYQKSHKIIHKLLKINIHIHNKIIHFIKGLLEAHNRKTDYIKRLKIDKKKSPKDLTKSYPLIILRVTRHRSTRCCSF